MATKCNFKGKLWLLTNNENLKEPIAPDEPFEFEATFSDSPGAWKVVRLHPISKGVELKIGKKAVTGVLTVTLEGSARGRWDATTGSIALSVDVLALVLTLNTGDSLKSTLRLPLDTDTVHDLPKILPTVSVKGRPLDKATGTVTLAGVGTFLSGPLNADHCAVVLDGTFSPSP